MGMGISNDPYAPRLVHTVRQTRMGLQTRYLMGMRAIVGVNEEETIVFDCTVHSNLNDEEETIVVEE